MFATLLFATLLSFFTLRAVRATEFTVATPQFTQCAPAHITWTATKGPYSLVIVNSSDPCGDPVFDLGEHHGESITWNVSVPSGRNVTISVVDANDEEAWSGEIMVQSSDDQSCLPPDLLANTNNTSTTTQSSSGYYTPAAITHPSTTTSTPTPAGNSANAKSSSSSGPIGGLNKGGALSIRKIPAPILLLGTISLPFALGL